MGGRSPSVVALKTTRRFVCSASISILSQITHTHTHAHINKQIDLRDREGLEKVFAAKK